MWHSDIPANSLVKVADRPSFAAAARALNAVKLERLFAAPFVGQLGVGHADGVYEIATHPESLSKFASASADGIVKTWDLTTREEVWHTQAHDGVVKGLCWTREGHILTCARDGAKLFVDQAKDGAPPIATWLGSFTSLSQHRSRNFFATSGSDAIRIYDLERPTAAPEVVKWPNSTDTITHVAFNQVEQSILASTATDRSIVLYDLRTSAALNKTILHLASNKIAWNPQEAFNFACANEDSNIYSKCWGVQS